MKIKNSSQSVTPDASIILMCVGILVACPLRIFQMLKSIDPVTGFFDNYSSAAIIFFYAFLALISLLILVLTFLSGKIPASIAPKGRKILLGLSSLVFAATLFYDAISSYIPDADNTTATIVQNVQSLSTLHHAHSACAFLSCCYFLVFCISYLSGNTFHKKLKLLSLAPLVWSIVRVLERITVIISIVRVSELLLELCAAVFLMLFFMTFARVVSEVNCKSSMWSVIACGSISALFILTYSIPRVMLTVTGNESFLVSGYPVNYADIACAVFVIVFIVTTLRSGYSINDVDNMCDDIRTEMEAEYEALAEAEKIDETINTVIRDEDGNIKIAKTDSAEDISE